MPNLHINRHILQMHFLTAYFALSQCPGFPPTSMCGIFAYLNHNLLRKRYDILRTLLRGLRALEYAGCDSCGLVFDDETMETPCNIVRAVGDVNALERAIQECHDGTAMEHLLKSHVGLAHTRWATHGAPSEANAHPQPCDADCSFVVVHNGIVPNYPSIRMLLELHGYTFQSESDTECIAKLCHHFFEDCGGNITFPVLVRDVTKYLHGPFGIVVKSPLFPNEMVACKRGSPLMMVTRWGLTREDSQLALEVYIASSAASLVEYSQQIVFLEDGDLVHVSTGTIEIYNTLEPSLPSTMMSLSQATSPSSPPTSSHPRARKCAWTSQISSTWNYSPCCSPSVKKSVFSPPATPLCHPAIGTTHGALREVSRQAQALDMELDVIMKGTFPKFMLKEIFEQPDSLKNAMRGRINSRKMTVVLRGIRPFREILCKSRRVLFVATGSAYYAALAVRNLFEDMVQIPTHFELASDFLDRMPPIFRDDACCFISHTGENTDVLRMLSYCKAEGALCVGITNQVGSSLAVLTDCGVYLHAGFELGVTSTKVFSSAVLVLVMLAVLLSEDRVCADDWRREIVAAMQELPELVCETLHVLNAPLQEIATQFHGTHNFLLMARGTQMAASMEGAQKLIEAAHVHCEAIHLGELKHGPLALVDENMPVVVMCTKEQNFASASSPVNALYPKVKSSLQQVLARHGRPIVIMNDEDMDIVQSVHHVVRVPKVLDCLQTIINIIPIQLLAYHLGVLRGIDVDGPRHSEN